MLLNRLSHVRVNIANRVGLRSTVRTQHGSVKRVKVGLMPGDGIGKEVVPAAANLMKEAMEKEGKFALDYEVYDAGFDTFKKCGNSLPPATIEGLRTCNGAVFGAVSSPSHKVEGYTSPIVKMRKVLDLYANVRPCSTAPLRQPPPGSRENVDMVIFRENTEGLYVKKEELSADGKTAIAKRIITEKASTRIAKLAFKTAKSRAEKSGKKSLVTIVHKANVVSVSDGLFRTCCLNVAKDYPDVEVEEQLVDSMLYRMIREPERYDVIVAPNLYGDILSDGAAALVGGLGLASSANVGDNFIMGEPVHGSAPDIEGQNKANPLATIKAMALLVSQMDATKTSAVPDAVVRAVDNVLSLETAALTPDLGGQGTTTSVANLVRDGVLAILGE